MNIQIQTQNFDLTQAIEAHVQKQLGRKLANAMDHITSVEVHLSDINGPKGGRDKKALIHVRLTARLSVKVEHTNVDLYAAISAAAGQAKQSVKRTLRKHQRVEKALLREMRQFPAGLPVG